MNDILTSKISQKKKGIGRIPEKRNHKSSATNKSATNKT